MRLLALCGLVIASVACSPATEATDEATPKTSSIGFDVADADVFVRSCDSQVHGPDVSTARRDQIGPLTLLGVGEAASIDTEDLEPNSYDGLLPLKFITQLEGQQPVWLVVASSDRGRASLIYDLAKWRPSPGDEEWRFPLASGSAAVRFDPCHEAGGYTQYNGGMLVAGSACITLDLYIGATTATPQSREVGFGREC